jgi:MFS family permease
MASTLGYWFLVGPTSALVVGLAVGFATATASMIQLDLAARICPTRIAGTVFALLMALSNAGVSLSTILGGYWYEAWSRQLGHTVAFNLLVGVGATFTAGCWFFVPALTRSLAALHEDGQPTADSGSCISAGGSVAAPDSPTS